MADVFISYSRKDTAFVRRLSDALEQRQREAWVDWEAIRPTEEFMLAIYAAIEGTNTFIFILTPDSVGSEVCAKEIGHAAKHNKRFIPIVHRDIDAKSVPETLAKLNWIFCREADDFAATVESLIDAIDTDLDWVRAHTRLLTRAIEWESKGKNTSFVLRGDDLRAAEKWLTEAGADKERQPTPLQTDYIIASRKAAARRQRITLGAVTFGAIVAVVLAILALIQRGEARKQEGIAKDNAAEATRQKDSALEALSQSDFAQGTRLIADRRPAQALAYLARAVRSNGNPAAATRIGSLLIERVWPLPIESPHADAVKTFFSPTGTHAVVVLADGSAEIRENATARPLSPRLRLEAGVDVACFSPDGARVVLAGDSWKEGEPNEPVPLAIQLWETNRGRAIAEPARFEGSAGEEMLVFSPDSRFLAITGVGEKMLVWDAQTGRELCRLERGAVPQFSRDGERVAIRAPASADNGEAAQVFETRTGKPIGVAIKPHDSTLGGIALSPNGLRIAAAFNASEGEGYGGSERVWEVATGKPVTPPMEHQSWVERLEFSPGGQWLLALGHAEARVWDARTGQPVTDWLKNPGADGLIAATFSPDGQRVATIAEGESVCVWDLATRAKTLQSLEIAGVTTAQFSSGGQRLIAGGANGVSRLVWDLMGASAQPLSLPGSAPVQHGFTLATFESDRFRVWDIRSAKILLESRLEAQTGAAEGELASGSFSANGNRLLVQTGFGARLWDLRSGKELPRLAEARLAELSRDGSRIVSTDKTPKIWDAESGRLLHEIKPTEAAESIVESKLSPDGRLVAVSSKSGETAGVAQLWDVESGKPASPPLAHSGPPLVSFSPDGARLVTLSTTNAGAALRLWKLPGAEPVGEAVEIRLEASEELPTPIFSHDGHRFVVVFANGGMRLFETTSGKLIDSPPMRKAGFVGARFSGDGKLLATAGNGIQVWNAATGAPLIDPVKPPERMDYQHVEFSSDGRRVLAAGIGGPEGMFGSTAIVDAATGRLLADARTDEFARRAAHFSPDDCLLAEETEPVRVSDIAPPGKGPAWLADLAEAVSGCALTAAGTLEVLPDRAKRLAAVREQLAKQPADDRWAQVARWFLAEPRARTISPYSQVKVADYVEHRVKVNTIEENTIEELEEALAASPAEPLARALLGVKMLTDSPDPHALARADGETLSATKLAPENAAVWQARAKVLTTLKRPTEAAAAAKKVAELSKPVR